MKICVRSGRAGLACAVVCIFTLIARGQVNVTTFHNDNARTGQNLSETTLTPANVNSNQFGKLFTVNVDGAVYAKPLYMSNLTIGGGTHNVLYVATEHDSLYAIDADNGAIYWQISFIPAGGSTVNSISDAGCSDLVPEIGITGTPVIDSNSKTLFVVSKTKEGASFVQRLHAIDLVTHAEKFGGPVVIAASVNGTGDGSSGGKVSFDALTANQRPALLLTNGHVIIAWASHCDRGPYHGWVMSYSASTLAQEGVFNTTPNGGLAGVWMSGDGLAADSSGNVYFADGNGTYDGNSKADYGDSIIKLNPPSSGTFTIADWFTPFNQSTLDGGDTDVGSGGVMLLPDLPAGSAHQHVLVQMGKEGKIYLVNRDNMGKFCSSCTSSDTQIVQEIPGATTGIWGSPAYWNGSVYWGGGNDGGATDHVKAFSFNANNSGLLSTSPTSESSNSFSFSTAAPVISANGNTNGILWILDNSTYNSSCCQILYAYDATNLGKMLYNSSQAVNNRDVPGGAVKFTAPTVANGKVYVGSKGSVSAFGIISSTPFAAVPTFSPAPGSYVGSVTVTLSDSTPGAVVHCTTDGTTPTAASPSCTAVNVTSTTTLKAIGVASGYNSSTVATGTYTITSGTGINFGAGFSGTSIKLNGSAALSGTRLRLTNGGTNQAGSAFYTTAVNVQNFTTDFSLQLSNPNADGMTFTIQGVGATALGPSGGGLGYGPDAPGGTAGIAKSVAVKFDLYNNSGEGADSTGAYSNGVSPTTPALDMTSSGVNLHSGDVFNVHMTYDGATLRMTITDASAPSQTYSASWAINIPATVGANTAFVGFTGGTGGLSATQDVISWTYTSSSGTPTAAAPTFSPAPGTYTNSVNVTLSDTTSGAVIHCTTDGFTTPTASSPVCTSLNVTATTTIKAIAVANGYSNSAVATGTYTISSSSGGINYGSGFSNSGLVFNGSAALNGSRLRLTNGGTNQSATAWFATAVNIQNFTTDFSFQLTNPSADGMTFTIQGIGTTALGPAGGGLGYGPDVSGGTGGIAKSLAVKFDIYNNNGEGVNSTGMYTNGASPTTPASDLTPSGVNLHSGDIFNVHMTYDGTTLKMTITDATTPAQTYSASWPISIPNLVGGNTAFVGFTAGTGGLSATQDVITWTYTPSATPPTPTAAAPTFSPAPGTYSGPVSVTLSDTTPGAVIHCTTDGITTPTASSPSCSTLNLTTTTTIQAIAVATGYNNSTVTTGTYTISAAPSINYGSGFTASGLALNGTAALNGTRLRLTNGGANQAATAWYATPVNVQKFTTDFSFQLTNPSADGLTFTIQGTSTTAEGTAGGNLAYAGIGKSVALKFDLYNNSGEGTNSTGMYTNGAAPTTPALDMTASGVSLHSGDIFNVHITYDGTALKMTIVDATASTKTFTATWTINIPATVGSNTAYVGFTGGTGALTATQDIVNWTYTPN